ncbi:MAG: NUDIX domain-containing protein [Thermoleophilia bacterium]
MPIISSGLLLYRRSEAGVEVLLVHTGGPYGARRDRGAWSIPKGQVEPGEDCLDAARREFGEETGFTPQGPYLPLGAVKYRNHKIIRAWAFAGDCDPTTATSITFTMEWPPRSGRMQEYPEVDRAAFFTLAAAREMIVPAQRRFLDELEGLLVTDV